MGSLHRAITDLRICKVGQSPSGYYELKKSERGYSALLTKGNFLNAQEYAICYKADSLSDMLIVDIRVIGKGESVNEGFVPIKSSSSFSANIYVKTSTRRDATTYITKIVPFLPKKKENPSNQTYKVLSTAINDGVHIAFIQRERDEAQKEFEASSSQGWGPASPSVKPKVPDAYRPYTTPNSSGGVKVPPPVTPRQGALGQWKSKAALVHTPYTSLGLMEMNFTTGPTLPNYVANRIPLLNAEDVMNKYSIDLSLEQSILKGC